MDKNDWIFKKRKKFLIILKSVFSGLTALCISAGIFLLCFKTPSKRCEIDDDQIVVTYEYFESLDESLVDITVNTTFGECDCFINIDLYNDSDKFLGNFDLKTSNYYDDASFYVGRVEGKASQYIVNECYEVSISESFIDFAYLPFMLSIIPFTLIFLTFAVKNKKYNIAGKNVYIYAGFSKHELYVDGVLKDKLYSAFINTPIILKTTIDDNKVEVTIPSSNKFTIKVNGDLLV